MVGVCWCVQQVQRGMGGWSVWVCSTGTEGHGWLECVGVFNRYGGAWVVGVCGCVQQVQRGMGGWSVWVCSTGTEGHGWLECVGVFNRYRGAMIIFEAWKWGPIPVHIAY